MQKTPAILRAASVAALFFFAASGAAARDSLHEEKKMDFQRQKAQELQRTRDREDDAARRILSNKERGAQLVSSIASLLEGSRRKLASAAAAGREWSAENGKPMPDALKAGMRRCQERLKALDDDLSQARFRLSSPDFVSAQVVRDLDRLERLADRLHGAADALAKDVDSLPQAGFFARWRLRIVRWCGAAWQGRADNWPKFAAVGVVALLFAAMALSPFVRRRKAKPRGPVRVSKGPLATNVADQASRR